MFWEGNKTEELVSDWKGGPETDPCSGRPHKKRLSGESNEGWGRGLPGREDHGASVKARSVRLSFRSRRRGGTSSGPGIQCEPVEGTGSCADLTLYSAVRTTTGFQSGRTGVAEV